MQGACWDGWKWDSMASAKIEGGDEQFMLKVFLVNQKRCYKCWLLYAFHAWYKRGYLFPLRIKHEKKKSMQQALRVMMKQIKMYAPSCYNKKQWMEIKAVSWHHHVAPWMVVASRAGHKMFDFVCDRIDPTTFSSLPVDRLIYYCLLLYNGITMAKKVVNLSV